MSHWTVIGVDTVASWPMEETELEFKGRKFLLRPETNDHAPSICLARDDDSQRESDLSLCREFMSAMAWAENQPVREDTICGNGGAKPILVGKGPRWQSIRALKYKCDYLPEPTNDKAKLALALYREALNVNSPAYSFLGHFKIINIIQPTGKLQIEWINANIGKVTDYHANERIGELRKACVDLGDHLYTSGRCAVAHAFSGTIVNPDDIGDTRRLHLELPIIKALAELAIERELGVKSRSTIWREHLYELDGFKRLIPEDIIERLKNRESVSTDVPISLPTMTIGIRGKADYVGFTEMSFNRVDTDSGVLTLHGHTQDGLLEMFLGLDFAKERLRYDILNAVRIHNNGSIRSLEYAISHCEFMIDLFCNGEFTVKVTATGDILGRSDPFMGVNIDLGGTIENLKNKIRTFEIMKATMSPGSSPFSSTDVQES